MSEKKQEIRVYTVYDAGKRFEPEIYVYLKSDHDKALAAKDAEIAVLEAKIAELTKPKEPVYKTEAEYFSTITEEITIDSIKRGE